MTRTPETVVELLHWAAAHPKIALRLVARDEADAEVSWEEIRQRALTVAGGLAEIGVRPGERVALVFPTGFDFFAAFFGALLAGAVPAPLYPPVRLGRLAEYHARTARLVGLAAAPLVLVDGRVRRVFGQVAERARPRLGCLTLGQLPTGDAPSVAPKPADLALVQFSSGTTVDPKPVALSHRALVAQARALNRLWPDRGDVVHSGVSWLPLYHDMGLIGCVLPALERPGALTLIPPEAFLVRPALWLRTISRLGATLSVAPNFAFGLCTERIGDDELDGVDLSCWRVAINGAEPVAPRVLAAFAERFARWGFRAAAMTPVYGLSEAALAVTFSSLDRAPTVRRFDRAALAAGRAEPAQDGVEMTSVGTPLEGFAVAIRGADGGELENGRAGEVWVRGPSLMDGYLQLPAASAAVLRDGWLATGDRGFIHRGELFLAGRLKDLLILRGRNHSPEEAEQATATVAGVRVGCVVAVSYLPEDGEGEQLVLLVERRRGVEQDRHLQIAEACRTAVLAATGLRVDRVEVLAPGTLPRTSSGKLRRQEALRRYLDGRLCPPEPLSLPRLAGAMLRSTLAFARAGPSAGSGERERRGA